MKNFHLHLVSDSTGETNNAVARACFVQFEDVEPIEHNWSMIRTERQLQKVIAGIKANPGVVLFTILDKDLTIEEGDLTPSMKLRRKAVTEKHRAELDAMYDAG